MFSLEEIYLTCMFIGFGFVTFSMLMGHIGTYGGHDSSNSLDLSDVSHSSDTSDMSDSTDSTSADSGLSHVLIENPTLTTRGPFILKLLVKLLSPMIWALFLFWFGFIGTLCVKFASLIPSFIVLVLAITCGIVSVIVYQLVIKLMVSKMNVTSSFKKSDLIGTLAKANLAISDSDTGEIVYTFNGQRCNSPARLMSKGEGINKGDQVIIIGVKNNLLFVERFKDDDFS